MRSVCCISIRRKDGNNLVNGLLIGIIGIAIMVTPFTLMAGVVFDTRSVLISVAALIFGFVPALIASVLAILVRIVMGGIGTLTRIAVIISSPHRPFYFVVC
jgi:hypothetical protein